MEITTDIDITPRKLAEAFRNMDPGALACLSQ